MNEKLEQLRGTGHMERGIANRKSRDMLRVPWVAFALFWLPAAAIVIAGSSVFSGNLRTIVWTIALITLGAGCIANAIRCGRVHCYITGPFFLAMAIVTLLYGLGIFSLGKSGWSLISLTILVGAIVLCCLPEMFFGKYRKSCDGNG